MNKDKFLTRRWNTIISLVQGLPTFAFIAYGIFSPLGGTLGGMIAISVVGGLFCLILEYHTSARFARQLEKSDPQASKPKLKGLPLVILVVHNVIYWFFLIPLLTPMSYRTGFVVYGIILLIRFIGNTYINLRDFSNEQYYAYPLRIP